MKLLINIIAIIVVAVVIGFQFNRTKNLYNKKYDENKDEFKKDEEQSSKINCIKKGCHNGRP